MPDGCVHNDRWFKWGETGGRTIRQQILVKHWEGGMLLGTFRTKQNYSGAQESKATVFNPCSFVFTDVRWLEALVLSWVNIREFCLSDAPKIAAHFQARSLSTDWLTAKSFHWDLQVLRCQTRLYRWCRKDKLGNAQMNPRFACGLMCGLSDQNSTVLKHPCRESLLYFGMIFRTVFISRGWKGIIWSAYDGDTAVGTLPCFSLRSMTRKRHAEV